MVESFLLLLLILVIYTVIPTVLMRVFGVGAYLRANHNGIALTFDDGPDSKYTPVLLDLLKRHGVKATFFVLGSKAERSPELIVRMHREGHLIGLHNYVHRTNGLMMPWKVRRQLARSAEIIRQITGETPQYYRPPWGVVNLFDFMLSKRFQIVLWSLIVGDWLTRTGKHQIKQRLISQLRSGSVIVLHDSGETFGADADAPEHMLEALDEFLADTLSRGFTFVRIDEKAAASSGPASAGRSLAKRCLVRGWLLWEALFHLLFRVRPLEAGSGLLGLRVRRYNGQALTLSDGETLHEGDSVIELHLDNKTLLELSGKSRSTMQLAVHLIRAMEQCMPLLARKMAEEPTLRHIKGLYGISMIHRGASQFGFTVTELREGWFKTLARWYLKWLLYVIHPQGKRRLDTRAELLTPKLIGISTRELLRLYPPPPGEAPGPGLSAGQASAVSAQTPLFDDRMKQGV